ncbi:MptD family putative ECF transporter S component [Arcanobacterium phocisimile]|nr:MptD family putative ECF transporter S component [Arcanobacterium phocisimile]
MSNQEMPELRTRSASGTNAQKIVYTGVFTAIYFVVFFAIGMLGFFGPQFMFVSAPLALLIEGTVIVLMLNKIRSFGALTILGIIVGLLMMLTGHAWTTLAFTVVASFLADLVAKSGNYTDEKKNIFAYVILQQWYIGAWLPIFYAADAYFADIAVQMGQEYADHMQAIFTPNIIIIFTIVNFFVALIGGWVGTKILRKNFAKAGIA